MNINNDIRTFWAKKEQTLGEKVLAKSFSRLIGKAQSGLIEKQGLLYCTIDNLYFEDFEKSSMMDFMIKQNTNYEKTIITFLISEISEMRKVSESSALSCSKNERQKAKTVSSIMGLFASEAWELQFKSDFSYFFEILNPNEFLKIITTKNI